MHIVKSSIHFQHSDSESHRSATPNRPEADPDHANRVASKKKAGYGHTMADVEKQILDWQEEMKQDNESLKVLSQSPTLRRE